MKKFFRKIIYGYRYSSDSYIKHLRKIGMSIGDGCVLFDSNKIFIDEQRPHMISIGKYCKISKGVNILAHDFSSSVILEKYGFNYINAKKTYLGDNVFIGMNTTILMGSIVGENTIIGANSLVCGTYPPNVVIGGCPAKIICTLDEYMKKLQKNVFISAKNYYLEYISIYNKEPSIDELGKEFPWLFLERSEKTINENLSIFDVKGIDEEKMKKSFMESQKYFDSYDDFKSKI